MSKIEREIPSTEDERRAQIQQERNKRERQRLLDRRKELEEIFHPLGLNITGFGYETEGFRIESPSLKDLYGFVNGCIEPDLWKLLKPLLQELRDRRKNTAPRWTFERPTEPGEYWLSIAPKKRLESAEAVQAVIVDQIRGVLSISEGGRHWITMALPYFSGAQWAKRETPADPFATTEERP